MEHFRQQSTGPFAIMDSTQEALDAIFQEFAEDSSCATAYPHPKAVFLPLIDQLTVHPVYEMVMSACRPRGLNQCKDGGVLLVLPRLRVLSLSFMAIPGFHAGGTL